MLLKDAGAPDAVVMALVGHEAVRQSDHYTHVGKESLAKAAAALPKLRLRPSERCPNCDTERLLTDRLILNLPAGRRNNLRCQHAPRTVIRDQRNLTALFSRRDPLVAIPFLLPAPAR